MFPSSSVGACVASEVDMAGAATPVGGCVVATVALDGATAAFVAVTLPVQLAEQHPHARHARSQLAVQHPHADEAYTLRKEHHPNPLPKLLGAHVV